MTETDTNRVLALQASIELSKGFQFPQDAVGVVKAAERYHAFLTGTTYVEKTTVKVDP